MKYITFWMIPIDLHDGRLIGFCLKPLKESGPKSTYVHVLSETRVPPLFGLWDFGDFVQNTPIVITEGVRDCLFIKQYYRYTLSVQTASVSEKLIPVISAMTNRVILALDNDEVGRRMTGIAQRKFRKYKVATVDMCPALNDYGKYFQVPAMQEPFMNNLSNILNSMR